LNLNFNKSKNNFIFKLNINPFLILYSIISKSIIINNSFKEENISNSRPLVIDLIDWKNKGKNKWDKKNKNKK
jgi:hypothetical protein